MPRIDRAAALVRPDTRVRAGEVGRWRGACGGDGAAPLVTIVTATMNAAAALPHTMRSLREQVGATFEWLVVDAGSSDTTVELLRDSEDIACWISEPDEGIYDAWNKACRRARGEWVIFIGAGDELAAANVLERMAPDLSAAHPRFDLVYGRVQYVSERGRRVLEEVGEPWEGLRTRWEIGRPALPPHPGVFHHRSLLSGERPFDTRFRIAGDSHLLLRHVLRKVPLFVPIIVDRTPVGGVSMQMASVMALYREIREINRELGLVPPFWHRAADQVALAGKVAINILPAPLARVVADAYRGLAGKPRRWSVR